MQLFEIVIALLLCGAGLAALARRIGAPYPALVALAGTALALTPNAPVLVLDPELALALFVAPVLLDAAFDASPRDLRANWRAVAGLAIGAVVLTVVTVAITVRALVPQMPWAAAIALGAIVAPPDAAAATAVLRQLRPPYRLLVILEGESLFNDASALVIYRLAVGAIAGGAVIGWNIIPMLLLVTAGSIVLGFIAARAVLSINSHVSDVSTAVILQFCGTFGIWLLAERLHLSGILTTVVFAMVAARRASDIVPARIRIPSYAVWEVAVFVFNVLAFILIGLQLRTITARLNSSTWSYYLKVAICVCAAAILSRILWVTAVAGISAWWCTAGKEQIRHRHDSVALSPRAAVLVGWCGMRGIVTLAAALALPSGSPGAPPFPYRDLILFTAFAAVLGTLILQGLTLRPLMTKLNLKDDGSVEREVRFARVAALQAALSSTSGLPATHTAELLRSRYNLQLRRANAELEAPRGDALDSESQNIPGAFPIVSADVELLRTAIAAEREQLSTLRAQGTIGDAAFQRVEQELDWRELDLRQMFESE